MLSPHCVTLIFLLIVRVNGENPPDSEKPDDSSASCTIPPGMYDNFPVDSFDEEPTSGSRCKVASTIPVQRIVYACMPRWCCPGGPCNCSTASVTRSRRDLPCTQLLCYAQTRITTNYTYVCCPGYNQVNGACVSNDRCLDNYLGCSYSCNTLNGVSSCTCPPGFAINSQDNRTCQDIDECLQSPRPCQDTCTNTNGSFTCSCRVGRQLALDGHNCVDINECTLPSNPCQDLCTNTDGSYVCSCKAGRHLTSDGHTCIVPIVLSSEAPRNIEVNVEVSVDDGQTVTPIACGGVSTVPYIVGGVVGSILLLSLIVFIILFCVCRPRKKPAVEVFVVGKNVKNVETNEKVDIEPFEKSVLSLYDEKKKMDDWKDISLNDDSEARNGGLAVKGMLAQPNIYSELAIRVPAASPKRFPTVKVMVSDLNSDYAEITT